MRSLLSVVLIGVMAAAGYWGARYWQSRQQAHPLNPGSPCDLTLHDCTHALPDGGRLVLGFAAHPVPPMKPIRVRLQLRGSAARPEGLQMTGVNMNMGVVQVPLKRTGEGRWGGETIIPICSRRQMQWHATLDLRLRGKRYRVVDTFVIRH